MKGVFYNDGMKGVFKHNHNSHNIFLKILVQHLVAITKNALGGYAARENP